MPLDTKVRIKLGRLQSVLVCLLLLLGLSDSSAPKCNKQPMGQQAHKTYGDNGFRLSVLGSPRLYRPGQNYTVSLSGERMDEGDIEPKKVKFIDFMIVAESNLPSTEVHGLGVFRLMPGDAMSKFSHTCSHAVMATSALSKEVVNVFWTAPEQGSGCIQLKAMVVERNDYWFMDDGALTYRICEDESPMASSPIVEPCKACDEAKYEVIFEGQWSRHTHPKDFPSNEWQTSFSHLIGASHSVEYNLWKIGEPSSESLRQLAERGDTKSLETEMKRSSQNIRSVIKARGLQQRSNVVGRTFAVFRVDAQKHLLSLVSKINPSPDWIVGVSLQNLCMPNGSWVDSRVIDLYPWDAGTNSGVTYQDPGSETHPRESIHRITSCNPADDRSPFYDETCAPIKPVARLHVLKQREYKKQCSHDDHMPLNPSWGSPNAPSINGDNVYAGTGIGPNIPPDTDSDSQFEYGEYPDTPSYRGDQSRYSSSSSRSRGSSSRSSSSRGSSSRGSSSRGSSSRGSNPCAMTSWSSWTGCSQTCGSASRSRSRKFVNTIGSQIRNCNKDQLFEKQICPSLPTCERKDYGGSFDPFFDENELAEFTSQWSGRNNIPSRSLTRETEDESYKKSYLHKTVPQAQSQVGSPSVYSPPPARPSDPYSDPYNRYSGYYKQKGYPPRSNHPSSARYNPYKDMGYYGYTYAGPPAQRYNQPSYLSDEEDREDTEDREDELRSCSVTSWGDWSHCSTDCGTGTRTRTRRYEDHNTQHCSQELLEDQTCEQTSGCQEEITVEISTVPTPRQYPQRTQQAKVTSSPRQTVPRGQRGQRGGRGQRGQRPDVKRRRRPGDEDGKCAVADWTAWSPCSVSCGEGYKIRTRVYRVPFIPNRVCDNTRLTQKHDCRMETCWSNDYYDQDPVVGPPEVDQEYVDVDTMSGPRHPYCNAAPHPGQCRGSIERWSYNLTRGSCSAFKYSGCGGNRNNFQTEEECLLDCHSPTTSLQSDQPAGPCRLSTWEAWSACSASCGSRGWSTTERRVLAQASPSHRPCPSKLRKRKRCDGIC